MLLGLTREHCGQGPLPRHCTMVYGMRSPSGEDRPSVLGADLGRCMGASCSVGEKGVFSHVIRSSVPREGEAASSSPRAMLLCIPSSSAAGVPNVIEQTSLFFSGQGNSGVFHKGWLR